MILLLGCPTISPEGLRPKLHGQSWRFSQHPARLRETKHGHWRPPLHCAGVSPLRSVRRRAADGSSSIGRLCSRNEADLNVRLTWLVWCSVGKGWHNTVQADPELFQKFKPSEM